jgi:hypothetical protein
MTIWNIEFSCGHTSARDLSDRAADERAGFARWLAERPCTDCWKAAHRTDAEATMKWLEAKRAEEQNAAEVWSAQYEMPPLEGTDRAVAWAIRCRHQILTAAYTALVVEGDAAEAQWEAIEEKARTITRASWWIDQRSSQPDDLTELLNAVTDADRPTENPYVRPSQVPRRQERGVVAVRCSPQTAARAASRPNSAPSDHRHSVTASPRPRGASSAQPWKRRRSKRVSVLRPSVAAHHAPDQRSNEFEHHSARRTPGNNHLRFCIWLPSPNRLHHTQSPGINLRTG